MFLTTDVGLVASLLLHLCVLQSTVGETVLPSIGSMPTDLNDYKKHIHEASGLRQPSAWLHSHAPASLVPFFGQLPCDVCGNGYPL